MTITLSGLHFHQDTGRDLLVSRSGDAETAVWLRKSLIDFEHRPDCRVDVVCPAELARERSLT